MSRSPGADVEPHRGTLAPEHVHQRPPPPKFNHSTRFGLGAAPHARRVRHSPTEAAADLISRIEGDRGFYAGAIGWCDRNGDGRWAVTIRCAELSADGTAIRAYAGGGLVAESDPQDELSETTVKFRTVLAALGAKID